MKKKISLGLISILSLCLIGCDNENIATVNGVGIPREYFNKSMEIVNNTNKYLGGYYIHYLPKNEGKQYRENLESTVFSLLIDNELIYQEAKKNGLLANENEINAKYEAIKKSLKCNKSYNDQIENLGIEEQYLKEIISRDLSIEKYKDKYLNNINISEEQLLNYYENNIEKFYIDEINASHILISTSDNNKNVLSREEKENLKEKAEKILLELKNGSNFEELAKLYSDDKISGNKGGNLGYFSKKDKNIEFSNEVFKLNTGEISNIIETSYGYHIVKINDYRNKLQSLDESKNEIKNILLNQKYNEHINLLYKNADIKKKNKL
ncbi:MAG: peptidylprolyl isomerase [Peptostreptococcaceae bacterium]